MDVPSAEPLKNTEPNSPRDPSIEVDKEELKSVKEALQQLTKTAKTLKIYLPNNPIYQKFLQELQIRFDAHLRDFQDLRLAVKQYSLTYKGQIVYENTNRLESLAFKLYVDGIRELTFGEGIDKDEITSLLEIIGREYDPNNPDDDMVTLLWERNFAHITYQVASDFIKETVTGLPYQSTEGFGGLIRTEQPAMKYAPASASKPLEEFLGPKMAEQASQIFVLSEEEVAAIKQQIKLEENSNPISTLIGILSAILRIEKDDTAFSEMVDMFDNVLDTIMYRGDFSHSKRILELFHELADPGKNLPESQRARLVKSIDRAGDSERIQGLDHILNQSGAKEADQLYDFWMLLNKNALVPLIDLLGRLTEMKMRRILCEVLIYLGEDEIDPLVQRLDDSRWYVVRNIVYILGRIGQESVIDKFRPLVTHKESRVRKELIHALDGMKDNKAKDLLVEFLDDPESSLRILAIRSLTNHAYRGALNKLEQLIEDREFAVRELFEKKEVFDALGKIGGPSMVPKLQKLIRMGGAGWFKKSVKEEMGLCAVLALKRIGTEDAIDALKDGQSLSSKTIREACSKALEEVSKSRG